MSIPPFPLTGGKPMLPAPSSAAVERAQALGHKLTASEGKASLFTAAINSSINPFESGSTKQEIQQSMGDTETPTDEFSMPTESTESTESLAYSSGDQSALADPYGLLDSPRDYSHALAFMGAYAQHFPAAETLPIMDELGSDFDHEYTPEAVPEAGHVKSETAEANTEAKAKAKANAPELPPHGAPLIRPSVVDKSPRDLHALDPKVLEESSTGLKFIEEPDGATSFEIEFGDELMAHVTCKLTLWEGEVTARFMVQDRDTLLLLESEKKELWERLEKRGLRVKSVSIELL